MSKSCIGPLNLEGEKLLHEKILEEIEKNNPTEKQLCERFPKVSYIIKSNIDRMLKEKKIEEYHNEGVVRYRITEDGKYSLHFLDKPEFTL
ncbi:MAG: hypothetical protein JW700_00955 [Candidatus Aenigmarchaeota archaeon]|nr:hypothetical protein [Candidatus Aenigmarchaeota archaeon]